MSLPRQRCEPATALSSPKEPKTGLPRSRQRHWLQPHEELPLLQPQEEQLLLPHPQEQLLLPQLPVRLRTGEKLAEELHGHMGKSSLFYHMAALYPMQKLKGVFSFYGVAVVGVPISCAKAP